MRKTAPQKHPSAVQVGKSYVFAVALEPDGAAWRAFVPELEAQGASTWGHTKDEALKNIQEVLQLVLEDLVDEHQPVPHTAMVFDKEVVAVSV